MKTRKFFCLMALMIALTANYACSEESVQDIEQGLDFGEGDTQAIKGKEIKNSDT